MTLLFFLLKSKLFAPDCFSTYINILSLAAFQHFLNFSTVGASLTGGPQGNKTEKPQKAF
jgi:hypothetical protein